MSESICTAYDAVMLACDVMRSQPELLRVGTGPTGGRTILAEWTLALGWVRLVATEAGVYITAASDEWVHDWQGGRIPLEDVPHMVAEAAAYTRGRHADSLDYRRAYEAVDSPPQGWAAS